MQKNEGVTYITDKTGKPRFVTLDLEIWGDYVNDLLDSLELADIKKEETTNWDTIKQELDKKHGL